MVLKRIRHAATIVGAILLASTAPRCLAQETAELSALYSSPAFQQTLIQKIGRSTLAAGQRSLLGASAPPSASEVRVYLPDTLSADLDYQATAGISKTLREQLALRVTRADPSQGNEVRNALGTDWIWQRFDTLLAGIGYSSRNLADVMASYYVGSWEIVNQSTVQPRMFRAVRDQLAASLRHSPEILLMSNAEKQRTSEALGILITVAGNGSQALLQKGDQIGFLAMQAAVHQSLLEQGIDLKRLTLTRRGFVPGG